MINEFLAKWPILYTYTAYISRYKAEKFWQKKLMLEAGWKTMWLFIKGPEIFFEDVVIIWAATRDFQQCGILTSVDSDEHVQPPFKLRNSKWCSVSSLTLIESSSDLQRLWSDCAYAQAGLSLCWSHIPLCWKSHALAHFYPSDSLNICHGCSKGAARPFLEIFEYPQHNIFITNKKALLNRQK